MREKVGNGDALHIYRPRIDSSLNKKETNGDSYHKRKDGAGMRDKTEDSYSTKHKDDIWRHREREGQQFKLPHEDSFVRLQREEAWAGVKDGQPVEDKTLEMNAKNMDDTKSMLSDKGNQLKDRRRHNEPSNWADRTGEGNGSQHGCKHANPHEKQSSHERSSRNEKLSSHSDRLSIASDNQQMHRGRERENTKKSKDIEVSTQIVQGLGKRRHEDHDTRRNEKLQVVLKGNSEQESSSLNTHSKVGDLNLSSEMEVSQLHHPSAEQCEDLGSDDKNQRGRSKVECWTSQKERNYSPIDKFQPLFSSSRAKEVKESIAGHFQGGEFGKAEGNSANDSDAKGFELGQIADRTRVERDWDIQSAAKLRMRSERFGLPMPGEKETLVNKNVENEVPLTPTEAAIEPDIKPERPARKRSWTGN